MRYDTLDSWRGICALMVMISHCQIASHFYIFDLVRHSFLFVDFFFVLSGFVIAINYQDRLMQGYSMTRFMLLRFFRVWPLHIAILIVYIAAELVLASSGGLQAAIGREPFNEKHSEQAILTNIFLVHSLPEVHSDVTWNEPSWSISVEFYTYLIYAVGIALVARLPWTPVLLVTGLTGLIIVCPLIIYFMSANKSIFVMSGGGLFRCVYGFAAGVLVAMAHARWRDGHMKRFSGRGFATAMEVLAATVTVVFVMKLGYSSLNLAAPFVFAMVIWVFAPQAGLLSDLLRKGPMLRLGELSYSVYMVHFFLLAMLYWAHGVAREYYGFNLFDYVPGYEVPADMVPGTHLIAGDLLVIAMAALSIGVAMLTYRWIEVPGRNFGRRLVGRKAQPAE